ncbi:unnamed protein product [Spirodela intermedia]|uniref:Uncharacterized protein n=1 Tax=Spirodela intermedia TaxID=51605 RepID=A0ABN7ECW2_SPIIN|nr:unnamed protein product [Spirodela intermedia]
MGQDPILNPTSELKEGPPTPCKIILEKLNPPSPLLSLAREQLGGAASRRLERLELMEARVRTPLPRHRWPAGYGAKSGRTR